MLSQRIKTLLANYQQLKLIRSRTAVEKQNNLILIDGKRCINFCSNDYLNIATHPDVIAALTKSASEYGLGSGSAPHICGYTHAHQKLEVAFAEFLKRDKAIMFNSGYHANIGVITALADRNSAIVADKLCHASILDGATMARATLHRYKHLDVDHAENLLQQSMREKLLISESIFSMEGNLADIKTLSALSKKHAATFILDDAHAIGVMGENGRGSADFFSQEDIDCLVTPLGKGVGSFGAIVSGKTELIETLLQLSRSYRYSTLIPPIICAGTLAALTILQNETWRRLQLWENIRYFRDAAIARELALITHDATPIQSFLIGSNEKALRIQEKLLQAGVYVSCIRPPTVPEHTARIRISLCALHTKKEISQLLDLLHEYRA